MDSGLPSGQRVQQILQEVVRVRNFREETWKTEIRFNAVNHTTAFKGSFKGTFFCYWYWLLPVLQTASVTAIIEGSLQYCYGSVVFGKVMNENRK